MAIAWPGPDREAIIGKNRYGQPFSLQKKPTMNPTDVPTAKEVCCRSAGSLQEKGCKT